MAPLFNPLLAVCGSDTIDVNWCNEHLRYSTVCCNTKLLSGELRSMKHGSLLTVWLGNEDGLYLTTLSYLLLITLITAVNHEVRYIFF